MTPKLSGSVLALTRRRFLLSTAAIGLAAGMPSLAFAEPTPGGTLTVNIGGAEPPVLVLAAHTAGAVVYITAKITEGLLTYDFDFTPKPLLATEWQVSEDGLRYWFKLREGVKWHDGEDFTADDVVFSILSLKEVHPRGRATYAKVTAVNALNPHEVEILLSEPAPYLISAFASSDIADHSQASLRGHQGAGERVEFEADRHRSVRVQGMAARQLHPARKEPQLLGAGQALSRPDHLSLHRRSGGQHGGARSRRDPAHHGRHAAGQRHQALEDDPRFAFESRGFGYVNSIARAEFNFDNPILANPKVRQAIAHAIDKDFIVNTVFLGYAKALNGPVSPDLAAFYDPTLPLYEFDPAKAEALLDEAGYPRGADGIRFPLNIDPTQPPASTSRPPNISPRRSTRSASTWTLRTEDFGAFVKKVYTDRDFDIALEGMSNLFDPTVGIQRLYWSKNFKPGVPFSNGANYNSPEVDRLLEAAAIEARCQKAPRTVQRLPARSGQGPAGHRRGGAGELHRHRCQGEGPHRRRRRLRQQRRADLHRSVTIPAGGHVPPASFARSRTMSHKRYLNLNVGINSTGYLGGAWPYRKGGRLDFVDPEYYIRLSEIAHRGVFDAVFFSDHPALMTERTGRPFHSLDPLILLTSIAARVPDIGLVLTASSTYNSPYNFARRTQTLDIISDGRLIINIVSSFNPNVAANFGNAPLPPRKERYAKATEFIDVLKKLWDSWDLSREGPIGPDQLWDNKSAHTIDHNGEFFSIKGPLNVPRSRQDQPVIAQAGASEGGLDLAARHGEIIYCNVLNKDAGFAFGKKVRDRAVAIGRDPKEILIVPGVVPIVADSYEAALKRHELVSGTGSEDGLRPLHRRERHRRSELRSRCGAGGGPLPARPEPHRRGPAWAWASTIC